MKGIRFAVAVGANKFIADQLLLAIYCEARSQQQNST